MSEALAIARRLRQIGDVFLRWADLKNVDSLLQEQSKGTVDPLLRKNDADLNKLAGQLIIQAFRAGHFRNIRGLQERIDWHTNDGTDDPNPSPNGPHVVVNRCAANLFGELVGNNQVLCQKGDDRKLVQLSDYYGGLLPAQFLEHFVQARHFVHQIRSECATEIARQAAQLGWTVEGVLVSIENKWRNAQSCFLLSELLKAEAIGEANTDNPTSGGPITPDGFFFQGKRYGKLQPTPWRLVNYLWHQRNRTAEYNDLARPVWNDDDMEQVGENAFGGARRIANQFFRTNDIPFQVAKLRNGFPPVVTLRMIDD